MRYGLAKAHSGQIVQYCSWQFVFSLGKGSLLSAYVSADCRVTHRLPTQTSDSHDH